MVSARTPPNTPTEDSSSKSSKGFGNTKQIPPSKKWCLTWNNYVENWKDYFDSSKVPEIDAFVLGLEVGEEGTPHIQGVIRFNRKLRPKNLFPKEIHWEKCRNWEASLTYCRKENNYIEKNVPRSQSIDCLAYEDMYNWQRECVDYCEQTPDDRTIRWYWEATGGVGKSALCKYLCVHHNALICSGKGADMKYLIVKYKEKKGFFPDLIIMDIPRSCMDYVSYTGIEEIKNGLFCSTKYECDMVIMNSPHVICFANEEPDVEKMSADRWDIIELNSEFDRNNTILEEAREEAELVEEAEIMRAHDERCQSVFDV